METFRLRRCLYSYKKFEIRQMFFHLGADLDVRATNVRNKAKVL
ncbi:unnamed protein product [Brassica oleracea var. botrytis]